MNALYALAILAGILTTVYYVSKYFGYDEQEHRQQQRNAIQRAKRDRNA